MLVPEIAVDDCRYSLLQANASADAQQELQRQLELRKSEVEQLLSSREAGAQVGAIRDS